MTLSLAFNRKPLPDLLKEALDAIASPGPPVVFACANPHSLVVGASDAAFERALSSASQLVVDGVGLKFACALLGLRVVRVTGADYFDGLMSALDRRGSGRVFFFGSSPAVLSCIRERFGVAYPRLTLCGTLSPPFGDWPDEENERMLRSIQDARPDVLWVGMTAPRQEKWVQANRSRLSVPVIGSIGAVFDFFAGTQPRASAGLRRLGLEWLHRLFREPRRLWRRNLISTPRFFSLLALGRIRLR